jgi:hypothetical protein
VRDVSRSSLGLRAALTMAVCTLLVLLSGLPASGQLGTPVASPEPGEFAAALPPAWLEFGLDGTLIARIIMDRECPALVVDGYDVGMTRRAPASNDFPVVACEATIPFGAATASIQTQDCRFQRVRSGASR